MYTRCPHCQTCFRIAEAHLKAAKGKVRCGSCKEVFDATSHIYDNTPDADPNELKSNPIIPEDEHQHIDLSSPPDRSNVPDQSPFMESMVGKDARYNNLDDMGTIDIPGDTNFTESFIKFVETEYDPEKKISAHPVPDPLIEQPPDFNTGDQSPATQSSLEQSTLKKAIQKPSPLQSREVPKPHDDRPVTFASAKSDDALSANPFIDAFAQQEHYEPANEASKDFDNEPKHVSMSEPEEKAAPLFDFETKPEPGPPSSPTSPSLTIEEDTESDLPPMFAKGEDEQIDSFDFEPEKVEKPKPVEREKGQYEDLESMEVPATNTDIEGIDDLYSAAQQQMEEPGSDPDKLNRDIEALLSDAMSIDDQESSTEQPGRDAKTDDSEPLNSLLGDINFLEDSPEEPNEVLTQFEEELQNIEFSKADAASFSLDNDDALENLAQTPTSHNNDTPNNFENDEIEDIVIGSAEPSPVPGPKTSSGRDRDDELPSAEDELPKALRSSFAHFDRPERHFGVTLAMGAGIFILVLSLLGQMVLFRSYQLANQFPSLTSVLTTLCEGLPCRYSGSKDVTQIELINRNVRSHPSQKNALLISTAFKNKAHFDQPYPTIAIKLSDLSGHVVATRYFSPEEYLEDLYNKFLLMESGTPVHVTLAVLDPGDDAINFEFSFL